MYDSIIFESLRLEIYIIIGWEWLEFGGRLEMTRSKGLIMEPQGGSQIARSHEEWLRRKGSRCVSICPR